MGVVRAICEPYIWLSWGFTSQQMLACVTRRALAAVRYQR